MIAPNDARLNAGYRIPDPIHPDSLVAAIEEVAARYLTTTVTAGREGYNLVARVAVELGCTWPEVRAVEDLSTELNAYFTPGAPLYLTGRSLEYWSLMDALSAQGWTWETIARCISNLDRNYNNPTPPF